ncbi:MAG: trypsin-like peptidase domain-containing protein [Erysipelotrichaceae bacterium]|nr:trypsin-like peptidase domain-containing protein [Erysipelotrichaceae bacterium]
MAQYQSTPPEFRTKKNSSGKFIILIICVALISGLFGFIGGKLGSGGNNNPGVQITQTTGKVSSDNNTINDVSDVVSKCGPCVVEITTEAASNGNSMFGQYIEQGAGSGVIFSEDGYIVTNNHVVNGATHIVVTTTDGKEYEADIVGTDPQSDLAVIKIDAKGLTTATMGDSDNLEVGDAAIAIGNPLGALGGTVTQGIISSLNRQIEIDGTVMTLLQTDASINPGNSGGGLFDANGNLIGIVNAKASSDGVEGLGFAIPINSAIDIINELMSDGKVSKRAALNVSLYDYSSRSNYYMDEDAEEGCYIVQIVEGGAADKAGLKVKDRIISVDGQTIENAADVKAILAKHKVGDTIEIVVKRDGQEITKSVKLQSASTN